LDIMDPQVPRPTEPVNGRTTRIGAYAFTIDPDISDNPRFLELKAYWELKRGARPMPTRAMIDPLDLKAHLGWLILAEMLPDGSDMRWRLIGSNIVDAYGRDSTGKRLSEIGDDMDPDYRRFLVASYRAVVDQAAIVRGHGPLTVVGRAWRRFDAFSLPLDAGDGTVGMVLTEQLMSV
jgi:hypothetical protein